MDMSNSWCEGCHEASTCTKEIIGYRRVSIEGERPYGKVYDTESEAWDIGDRKYDGSFEVFPVCR